MKLAWSLKGFGLGVFIGVLASGCVGHIAERVNSDSLSGDLEFETSRRISSPAGKSGMTVYVDPKTGEIISRADVPSPSQIPQPLAGATAAPLPELQQTLSPMPGGGVMIRLDERFSSPLTAAIDTDGKVRVDHQDRPAIR